MKNNKFILRLLPKHTEQPYMQTVLYIILLSALVISGMLTIAGLLIDMQNIEISTAIAFVFCAMMLWFTYRNTLWVPRILVPLIAYGVTTYIIFTNATIRDLAMFVYPIAILLSGMLIGEAGVVFSSMIITITVMILGYADITYMLSSEISQYNNVGNVLLLAIMQIITGSILYVTIKNLNRSLIRAQLSESEAAQRYQELQTVSASLEQQVEERSQSALAAQKEAVKANRALEKRMWQFKGMAYLSDLMRGEQDVTTLAQNIIHGLCEYLEVPIGVIFLLEESVFSLAGSYAYPLDDTDTPQSFTIDEGVIGQAAREQRIIKLSDVPSTYIDISSGLGKASARHILVIPFTEDNRVVGVIEIGSFTELFPHQVQFIESVLKDIGIAFSTAQARMRIDELLRKTQQMTEELQAQEEELRAANEELEVQTERLRESYVKLEQQADKEES
jgi:predicted transcriptional regulator